jgi:hypothetical protein
VFKQPDFEIYLWTFRDLSSNCLSGAFSTGPYFNPGSLYLSNNDFASVKFANFTGPAEYRMEQGTVYMPLLVEL